MTPKHTAAIALGSNLPSPFGTPADNLHEAIHRLACLGELHAVSNFHVTAPVGYLAQPDFVNAAALLETTLSPHVLLTGILAIEADMGRDRLTVPPQGPRIIDLDLLFYDSLILATPDLILPHPAMHLRRFVLAPLAEISPQWRHPAMGQTVADMLSLTLT